MRGLIVIMGAMSLFVGCGGDAGPRQGTPRYDCSRNFAGTGVLADDVLTSWFFVQNGSGQSIEFLSDGTAYRTASSDEPGAATTYSSDRYEIADGTVTLLLAGVDITYDFTASDGQWRVAQDGTDLEWVRCEPVED